MTNVNAAGNGDHEDMSFDDTMAKFNNLLGLNTLAIS